MNQRADFLKRLGDCLPRGADLGLHVIVGDEVAGHLAGKFADRVGAHSVGDHEDVPAVLPDLLVGSPHSRVTILVVQAPHPLVGICRVDDDIIPVHGLTLAFLIVPDRCPLTAARAKRSTTPPHQLLHRLSRMTKVTPSFSSRPHERVLYSEEPAMSIVSSKSFKL